MEADLSPRILPANRLLFKEKALMDRILSMMATLTETLELLLL